MTRVWIKSLGSFKPPFEIVHIQLLNSKKADTTFGGNNIGKFIDIQIIAKTLISKLKKHENVSNFCLAFRSACQIERDLCLNSPIKNSGCATEVGHL